MCGIAGCIEPGGGSTAEALRRRAAAMADTLCHRGPDDDGTWADAAFGVALGHRRLAIIDLSAEGRQPMASADGRYVLDYNGELYNYRDLRRELESAGVRFRGSSDTEVLVGAVARWGVHAALRRTNGMFAFAVWDGTRRRLVLARDRLGEKPLYYGWAGSTFLFASECKALRRHPAFDGAVDRDALAAFLRYGYVPAPQSIYAGVRKLLPGTLVEIDPLRPGSLPEPVAYWSLHDAVVRGAAAPFDGAAREAADRLERLLRDSVRNRMAADVPLGAFLSGGIDSSTVVALMQAQSSQPVKTFTIGFHEAGFDEAQHAKAVAAHVGTDHRELYVTPAEAQAVIPSLPELYDEPFADSSQVPTFLVSRLAREEVKVSLSGDGGDELFGGYTRYLFHRRVWDRLRPVPGPVRRGVAAALTAVPPQRWDALVARADRLLPRRLPRDQVGDKVHKAAAVLRHRGAEDFYRQLVSHWGNSAAIVLGGRDLPDLPDRADAVAGWTALPDATQRMMALDTLTYLPDDILVKVDRASMAASLEARVPLLDHEVVEFAWSLPVEWKLRGDEGKWLLRQVLRRYVPDDLINRPKMGFGVPIGEWLRGPLRPWGEDLLAPDRLRREGYFDVTAIRDAWTQHLAGTRDWKYHLWDVLMFQAWLERWTGPGGV